jgi:membrane-bound metal-dependent hydrolase YbcI (DUF457 family)
MPTPIGHAIGGLIVGLLTGARGATGPTVAMRFPGAPQDPRTASAGPVAPARPRTAPHPSHPSHPLHLSPLLWCALAACLPDIDFFWGRHNMETHSLGFAALVGLGVLVWRRDGRLALACTLAVCTHVLFDWLGSDDFPPLGVMAFWPVTTEFYFANAFVFDAISRRYWLPGFVQHNIIAVLREIAILAPVAGPLLWWRVRRTGHVRLRGRGRLRRDSTAWDPDS